MKTISPPLPCPSPRTLPRVWVKRGGTPAVAALTTVLRPLPSRLNGAARQHSSQVRSAADPDRLDNPPQQALCTIAKRANKAEVSGGCQY